MLPMGDALKLETIEQVIVLHQAGRMSREKVMSTTRLFGEEIIPHLK